MANPPLSKSEYIGLLIKGQLMNHVATNKLVKPGERFTYAQLFGLTKEDLVDYFAKNGYPPLDKKDQGTPPYNGDYETVWTFENGEYTALWLEKGTSSNLFSSPSKEEFQKWWNENLLKDYEFQLTYPWRG